MKRLNLRNNFALTLLFALILPILAACGGGTTAPAAPTAGSAAQAPTAAPAAGAATAAPAEAPTVAAAEAPTAAAAEPAPGTTANAKPGILRINNGPEGDNYDPHQASFLNEIRWILLNWQPLMSFDQEMKPIPGAAESHEVSADGKTYTFKLRPDSKYSNGDPLTAADWVRAWQRLGDPELAGEYQFIACDIIKGYSEYSASTCQGKTITETLALDLPALREGLGVKAVDDNTLQIELVNPAPYFLSIAALWVSVPVREVDAENVADLSQAVPESFIGNGPFKLVEHERDTKAVWELNENYKGPFEGAKLKGIEMALITESQVAFQAYKNGELDMIGLAAEDRAAVEADPVLSKELIDVPGQCTFYLAMHNKKAPFDNPKVRQAFAQAIDRDAYVRDVLQGLGKATQTFIPPGFPGYEPSDQWAFNPDAAKATLAEAGFANGQGLPEIKLTYSASARNKVRFEWMANALKQNLGVDAILDPVDPTVYTGLTKDIATTPPLYLLGWCADFPDPQNWLTAVFHTNGINARIGHSNPEFDKLVEEADITTDAAKRADLYSQAQKMLIETAPVAFLYNDAGKALVKPYVKGVKTIPLDFFPGFYVMNQISVEP